jgi:hypothetical protein
MKASAFNGDVEIFVLRMFLTVTHYAGYSATSMPTKKVSIKDHDASKNESVIYPPPEQ